jgi:hypothetical protein
MLIREGLHQRQLHGPVDTPKAVGVIRPQGVLHEVPILRLVLLHDAIGAVVETCGLCPRVRDQGFGLREREVERLPQEPAEQPLDRLGLLPWSTETDIPQTLDGICIILGGGRISSWEEN